MSLEALFCDIDDFCHLFLLPQWEQEQLTHGERRRRPSNLSVSEIMAIIVHFH